MWRVCDSLRGVISVMDPLTLMKFKLHLDVKALRGEYFGFRFECYVFTCFLSRCRGRARAARTRRRGMRGTSSCGGPWPARSVTSTRWRDAHACLMPAPRPPACRPGPCRYDPAQLPLRPVYRMGRGMKFRGAGRSLSTCGPASRRDKGVSGPTTEQEQPHCALSSLCPHRRASGERPKQVRSDSCSWPLRVYGQRA